MYGILLPYMFKSNVADMIVVTIRRRLPIRSHWNNMLPHTEVRNQHTCVLLVQGIYLTIWSKPAYETFTRVITWSKHMKEVHIPPAGVTYGTCNATFAVVILYTSHSYILVIILYTWLCRDHVFELKRGGGPAESGNITKYHQISDPSMPARGKLPIRYIYKPTNLICLHLVYQENICT